MNVLIVDDSSVFRTVIKAALRDQPDIKIAGSAQNGEVALKILRETPVDWVILDMEMPILDGLETMIEMRKEKFEARVLIFASSSVDTYPRIRRCLELGAVEFILKPDSESVSAVADSIQKIRDELIPLLSCKNLKAVSAFEKHSLNTSAAVAKTKIVAERTVGLQKSFEAVVVASSTGGPVALEKLCSGLQGNVALPIFIVQHIAAPFTRTLAERLALVSGVSVSEAQDGEKVVAGRIYIAPGDFHMELEASGNDVLVRLNSKDKINFVRPAADPLFASAAKIYGENLLSFVLTGMGADGLEGTRAVQASGGRVIIQDRESSVVWGMPGAVHAASLFDVMASLDECSQALTLASQKSTLNFKNWGSNLWK